MNKTVYIKHGVQEYQVDITLDLEEDFDGRYYIQDIYVRNIYDESDEEVVKSDIENYDQFEDKIWHFCEQKINQFINQISEKY